MMVDHLEVRDLGGAESEELQDVGAGARYELAPALGAPSASSSSLAPPAARPHKPEQMTLTPPSGFNPDTFIFFCFHVITKGAATSCPAGLGLAPTDSHPLPRQSPLPTPYLSLIPQPSASLRTP